MTVTSAIFRQSFPEFENIDTFPDTQINFWISMAGKFLNTNVFGDVLDFVTQLYVAHNLVISRRNITTVEAGGVPGSSVGIVMSKSVGPASVSYDTSKTTMDGAGTYNATLYGVQFLEFARMFGAGGIQLSGVAPDMLT